MARSLYTHEELGREIEAPSGYYQPMEEAWLAFQGRQLLYVLGAACIEASCCGVGSWSYLRVEGYSAEDDPAPKLQERGRAQHRHHRGARREGSHHSLAA